MDPESIIPEPEPVKIIKVVPIRDLLETGASWVGYVASWWAVLLMQGGIFFTTVETKDCFLVMIIFIFICFRGHEDRHTSDVEDHRWPIYNTVSKKSMWGNIQQLVLPIGFINELTYWCKLVSTIICAALSIMRLVSQDFGQTKVEHMATRNLALNAFHVLALIETLLSFLALMLRKFTRPPPPLPSPSPPLPSRPECRPPPKDKRKEKFTIPDEMNTDGQQKDQSDNFGVTRRKGPSVDPAGTGKQTEEKKVEVKKSQ